MRKISKLATVLITSLVMTLAGQVASPIAIAAEAGPLERGIPSWGLLEPFEDGPTSLTYAQMEQIKRAVAISNKKSTFIVTGAAGKSPKVSDKKVQELAKKRGEVVKSYLVKLGVKKSNVEVRVKMTRSGLLPKTEILGSGLPMIVKSGLVDIAPGSGAAPGVGGGGGGAGGGGAGGGGAGAPLCADKIAASLPCEVGDRGLGGGIVFYVSATSFASPGSTCNTAGAGGISVCKYLEVAPATWQSAGVSVADDLTYVWSTTTSSYTGQDYSAALTPESGFTFEQVNWKIGGGFSNTSLMTASDAKSAVIAYAGSATAGQWFIPSMNELNELCKYARGQTTGVLTVKCDATGNLKTTAYAGSDLGGFGGTYWSSSENFVTRAWSQSFGGGAQSQYNNKPIALFIRPIRAF